MVELFLLVYFLGDRAFSMNAEFFLDLFCSINSQKSQKCRLSYGYEKYYLLRC